MAAANSQLRWFVKLCRTIELPQSDHTSQSLHSNNSKADEVSGWVICECVMDYTR